MGKMLSRAASIIAALTLFMASPATTEGVDAIPQATEARAKFPNEPGSVLDALHHINLYANTVITPESDEKQYGFGDFWVMAPESGKGDCDDYALTKMFMLGEAGFEIVSHARIRGVHLYEKGKLEGGHAILEVLLPNGSVAILDNLHRELMTRAELEKRGYKFFDW